MYQWVCNCHVYMAALRIGTWYIHTCSVNHAPRPPGLGYPDERPQHLVS